MSKTINGISENEILNGISVFVKPRKKTYKGFDYREIEDFYNRLWEVCGKKNVIVTQPSNTQPIYTTLPTGQVICSVYIEVSILYDDGTVFRTIGSWGETELVRQNESGRFDGIGNIIDIASAKALKLALKKLDCFATYSDPGSEESNKSSSAKKPAAASKPKPEVKPGTYSLKGKEPIQKIREDANTGLPVYTWLCYNEGGDFNVVFYPNKYGEVQDWMERLVDASKKKPDTLIKIGAKELSTKDGVIQLMFDSKA